MIISRIEAGNWRSWSDLSIQETDQWNIICGANGSGKTAILETIWALHRQRTARGNPLRQVIQRESKNAWARVFFEHDSDPLEARIQIEKGLKYRLQGEPVQPGKLSWMFPVILMQPSDVQLITGSPSGRRELLQRLAFQTDQEFLQKFRTFSRTLEQRNSLLRDGTFGSGDLAAWDRVYIPAALEVELALYKSWLVFYPLFQQILSDLFPGIIIGVELQLSILDNLQHYDLSVAGIQELEEETARLLLASRNREQSAGFTLVGPHRMDFLILFDGSSVRDVGSQGQIRATVLAMRLAMTNMMIQTGISKPVVLVDDMAGEMDDDRSTGLLQYLKKTGVQVWLTVTDLRHFPDIIKTMPHSGWQVRDGKLQHLN